MINTIAQTQKLIEAKKVELAALEAKLAAQQQRLAEMESLAAQMRGLAEQTIQEELFTAEEVYRQLDTMKVVPEPPTVAVAPVQINNPTVNELAHIDNKLNELNIALDMGTITKQEGRNQLVEHVNNILDHQRDLLENAETKNKSPENRSEIRQAANTSTNIRSALLREEEESTGQVPTTARRRVSRRFKKSTT